MVRDGLDHLGAVEMDSPTAGPIRRFEVGDWNAAPLKADSPQDRDTAPLKVPDGPVPTLDPAAVTLAPSDLGGAKALPGDDDEDDNEIAKARGRILHTLSETLPSLPSADRASLAQTLVARHADRGLVPDAAALIDEVLALLSDPDLAAIFDDGLAEVDITATLPALDNRRIHGAIDRLLVTETEVLAVDLKSNRMIPNRVEQVPVGLRRQMAAYRDALVQVYTDRPVRTALLWTRTGTLMPLPDEMLTRALAEVGTS
jgi:ATP-dependent helicase/nuclease subunit A